MNYGGVDVFSSRLRILVPLSLSYEFAFCHLRQRAFLHDCWCVFLSLYRGQRWQINLVIIAMRRIPLKNKSAFWLVERNVCWKSRSGAASDRRCVDDFTLPWYRIQKRVVILFVFTNLQNIVGGLCWGRNRHQIRNGQTVVNVTILRPLLLYVVPWLLVVVLTHVIIVARLGELARSLGILSTGSSYTRKLGTERNSLACSADLIWIPVPAILIWRLKNL